MIGFDEALEIIRSVARPGATESVRLEKADNRVLAEAVKARISSPRTDVSAMDGYAVRDSDLASFPARLEIIAESFAGGGWHGEIGAGECARIFTGAPVPRGATRVVMQENVRRDGEWATIDADPGGAAHIRRRGGDFEEGDRLLAAGRLLDPRAVVAAAAADVAELKVHARPRLHIISTGDELAEPGTAAASPGAIPESVSPGVAALARQWGALIAGRTRVADELAALTVAAESAVAEGDVVAVTGGASVGERDFAKAMFEPLGLELLFSKVAIKPGKPVWLGRCGDAIVVGLPGNPTSAMVTARLFLAPLLAGLGGRDVADALDWRSLPLADGLATCGPRETFHRARHSEGKAEILSFQDSSAQKALAEADLLVRQRAHGPALAPGSMIEALDF